jgi:hypothetical protein
MSDGYGDGFSDTPMFVSENKKKAQNGSEGLSVNKAYVRRTDPKTSHDAADSIAPILNAIEVDIYAALVAFLPGGATSDEIVVASGIQYRTVTPRLKPMVRKGFVEDSGETKKGESGRKQIIWRAIV